MKITRCVLFDYRYQQQDIGMGIFLDWKGSSYILIAKDRHCTLLSTSRLRTAVDYDFRLTEERFPRMHVIDHDSVSNYLVHELDILNINEVQLNALRADT